MDNQIKQLVDLALFQVLQDQFNQIVPFTSAVIDNQGKIHTATVWQDMHSVRI
jgi:hypothetical protein